MSKKQSFDVIVIGSGSAGFSAVEAASAQGVSVCLIEKARLGGECPNYACIPSKALLKSAHAYRSLSQLREVGVDISKKNIEWEDVQEYRKRVVERITGGGTKGDRYLTILKKLGVKHVLGEATFIDDNTIQVNEKTFTAKSIVIAAGTEDFIPPISGIDKIPYLNWKQALQLKKLPKSIAIIGGGPVGCEMATIFASFGVRVTLLQASPYVLNREDSDVSERAFQALKQLGVDVVVSANIEEFVNGRVGVIGLRVQSDEGENMYAVEQVILATGKRFNASNLGVDTLRMTLDERGYIKTNRQQKTSIKHIFAAGDVNGGLQFTHTAHHEGWVAGYNAAQGAKGKNSFKKTDERVVPRVTFIDPEVASVGLTEAQVMEEHGAVFVGSYDIGTLGRSVTEDERLGFIKIVAHPKTKQILGGHAICPHAGEMIHEIALAMYLNAQMEDLASMIHAFPTYSEGIKAAASTAVLRKKASKKS